MFSTPLISPDNTWALMAIACGWAAFSIYAEQTWTWASKISGAIVALLGALILTNVGIIPTNCVFFDDIVWGYVVPMAIPLLLLTCDVRKIGKEAGKILVVFLFGAIGTTLGAILGFQLLGDKVPNLAGVAAMMTGSYIGGTVNFAAMASAFEVPGETTSAAVVADNLLMTLYFFVLIAIPSIKFFRNKFTHPHMDEVEAKGVDEEGFDPSSGIIAKLGCEPFADTGLKQVNPRHTGYGKLEADGGNGQRIRPKDYKHRKGQCRGAVILPAHQPGQEQQPRHDTRTADRGRKACHRRKQEKERIAHKGRQPPSL